VFSIELMPLCYASCDKEYNAPSEAAAPAALLKKASQRVAVSKRLA